MHTESDKQGCVNLRGQGQRSSQGQMTKMTYFKTKRTVIYQLQLLSMFSSNIYN